MSLEGAIAYAQRGRGQRRRPSSGWEGLTPTEVEVVRLVADGLSNPDIAERLFISRKTVTTHLSHVFGKLGVSSRSELSAEAVRRGM
jgi:DNA-binding CsgD family transcriptional regulator